MVICFIKSDAFVEKKKQKRYNQENGKGGEKMEYSKTGLDSALSVDSIYTIHYFEYEKDFAYSGEYHDFWEIVYADRGNLAITAGAREFTLEAGQLYLHKPGEFHNIHPDAARPANSVIFSFDCENERLFSVAGNVITCSPDQRRLIGQIIKEAEGVFSNSLGNPYTTEMVKKDEAEFGGCQLIQLYIEQLLITLVRGTSDKPTPKKNESSKLLIAICDWLEENVQKQIKFGDILKEFNVSASVVKKLFREQMDCGAMEHFNRLKVDAAKQMIREKDLNFTEIADRLGFNTSQYFTTVFRRVSGMTPTEYVFSVRSNFERKQ